MAKLLNYNELNDQIAEVSLLGSILLQGEALEEVADFLKPGDFYNDKHATIYRACLSLFNSHRKIDMATLPEQLKVDGKLEETGGSTYLSELASAVPTAVHIKKHAEIVRGYATRRQLYGVYAGGIEAVTDLKADTNRILTDSQNAILEIGKQAETEKLEPDSDKLDDFLAEIENRKEFNASKRFVGLDTGFKHLNEVTLGLQTGLWIIGARPSLGKTTFVKQLLDQVAMNNPDTPCLFVSYEQSGFELLLKTVSRFSGINSREIQKGRLDKQDEVKINEALERYNDHAKRIYICEADGGYTTTEVIKAKARQLLKKHNAKKVLVVIDYLQLIPSGNGYYKTDKERLDRACSDLRRLARDLDSPVVAVSSLNRPAYNKGGKADMSSFKESGGIEYSADLAVTMEENEEANENLTEQLRKVSRFIDFKIHKNRNGERGTIKFKFDMPTATFTELDKGELEEGNDLGFG